MEWKENSIVRCSKTENITTPAPALHLLASVSAWGSRVRGCRAPRSRVGDAPRSLCVLGNQLGSSPFSKTLICPNKAGSECLPRFAPAPSLSWGLPACTPGLLLAAVADHPSPRPGLLVPLARCCHYSYPSVPDPVPVSLFAQEGRHHWTPSPRAASGSPGAHHFADGLGLLREL